jgi:hypothetical protein
MRLFTSAFTSGRNYISDIAERLFESLLKILLLFRDKFHV